MWRGIFSVVTIHSKLLVHISIHLLSFQILFEEKERVVSLGHINSFSRTYIPDCIYPHFGYNCRSVRTEEIYRPSGSPAQAGAPLLLLVIVSLTWQGYSQ